MVNLGPSSTNESIDSSIFLESGDVVAVWNNGRLSSVVNVEDKSGKRSLTVDQVGGVGGTSIAIDRFSPFMVRKIKGGERRVRGRRS